MCCPDQDPVIAFSYSNTREDPLSDRFVTSSAGPLKHRIGKARWKSDIPPSGKIERNRLMCVKIMRPGKYYTSHRGDVSPSKEPTQVEPNLEPHVRVMRFKLHEARSALNHGKSADGVWEVVSGPQSRVHIYALGSGKGAYLDTRLEISTRQGKIMVWPHSLILAE